ncbi:MAG: Xaa-Pro peptidase family protein [Anaerolineae bacterium]|nr:Xaa-Pro peptidase family protein [Thermoflexales bacterium]MDW8407501.1 Xaa-Pro peptidase family protein [Anaerolineae bacterium]
MQQANWDRFRDFLRGHGFEAALLSSPATLTWLTGYAPPIQTGPSPFEGGPALAWVRGDEFIVVASDAEAPAIEATGVPTRAYVGYTIEQPLAGTERQLAALLEVLKPHAGLHGTVAVELNALPAAMLGPLHDALPNARLQPQDGALNAIRAIKTAEELDKIRAALRLCDLAHEFVRPRLQAGVREIELWGQMKAHLEADIHQHLPLLADLVGGLRTAEIGGPPGEYVLQEGDPLILDMVPRLNGYWGDNAATYFVGEPSAQLRALYNLSRDTLRRGIEAVRPGVKAKDLDHMLRSAIRDAGYAPYPHHSGHGIGVTFHEEPRIVPYNDMALEAGMVILLEPGVYVPGVGGVRLEHALLVKPDGCEILTHHLQV